MQFKLRSLLAITALAAVLTMPTYHFSVALYEKWNQPEEGITIQLPRLATTTHSTVVSVPDGGTVLIGGIKRSKWDGGKMISKPTK